VLDRVSSAPDRGGDVESIVIGEGIMVNKKKKKKEFRLDGRQWQLARRAHGDRARQPVAARRVPAMIRAWIDD